MRCSELITLTYKQTKKASVAGGKIGGSTTLSLYLILRRVFGFNLRMYFR